ncbi:MAG TPA: tetratricopeptide repeat-containing protein [Pyrinomonadaceae bacterium]|jgi:hypothetical protein|nr:tetratricopeptide repeat-containing protein [Pyrinomonadaceae bacterium]
MSPRATRAFIVRPFGKKKDASGNEIDFDAVERELIAPALERLGIEGRTTIDIVESGNIRVDMFRRLLLADLVVADLSIHNANVFYELGIRHALRNCHTFMLRCDADKFPFDLQTDRYFVYQSKAPAADLDKLAEAIGRTIDSHTKDSPVFMSLPSLKEQDTAHFIPIPLDFGEEVDRAAADRQFGDLELLAAEVKGLEWGMVGLRAVGRAQFKLKAFNGARATWEAVRLVEPLDLEANILLGTVLQRLGDLTGSTQALERALKAEHIEKKDRAEAYALMARNAKTHWQADWQQAPPAERPVKALRSRYLQDSYDNYERAFEEDFNHFYSGLNALAMLTVMTELAAAEPKVWAGRFKTAKKAEEDLEERAAHAAKLAAAVDLSLEATRRRLEQDGKRDEWADISAADLRCLTSRENPEWVASGYEEALAGASDFAAEAARKQLALYRDLGILKDVIEEVVKVTGLPKDEDRTPGGRKRVLIFTGHMIDAPGREKPRFPPDKEAVARQKIKETVEAETRLGAGVAYGIAGGASGGDILFHEVCAELGVPTQLYLALPRGEYVKNSVQKGGPAWVERFRQLYERLTAEGKVRVLSQATEEREYLPVWLRQKESYDIWQRSNLWMLHNALAAGGDDNVTLIALWDGEPTGDGPGGTSHLVQQAGERGAKSVVINTKQEFGL